MASAVGLVLINFGAWIAFSIMMFGNNIYVDRRYLLITASFLLYKTFVLMNRFHSPENMYGNSVTMFEPLFLTVGALMATVRVGQIILGDETLGAFYTTQANAKQYTAHILSCAAHGQSELKFDAAKYMDVGKRLYSNRFSFPPLLLLAAAATLPALLSIGYATVHLGERELDKLEAIVEWNWAIAHQMDKNIETLKGAKDIHTAADTMAARALSLLDTLDRDRDGLLSWEEAQLEHTLGIWRVPKLSGLVSRTWEEAGMQRQDKQLSASEIGTFGQRLRTQFATYDAWQTFDAAAATLLNRLDANGDGYIEAAEMPLRDFQASLEAAAGLQLSASDQISLSHRIEKLRERAAADCCDSEMLNAIGLTYLLSDAKREVVRIRPKERSTKAASNHTKGRAGEEEISSASSSRKRGAHELAAVQEMQNPTNATNMRRSRIGKPGIQAVGDAAEGLAADFVGASVESAAAAMDEFHEVLQPSALAKYVHALMASAGFAPPYWRFRAILHFSALLSFLFAFWCVAKPFLGYLKAFDQMQSGNLNIKGTMLETLVRKRTDYATLFPGTFFSTALLGYVVVLVMSLFFLVTITSSTFWSWIISLKFFFVFFAASLILHFGFLRMFLMNWYCQYGGEIVAPRVFSCIWFVMTAVNFVLGGLLSLWRLIFLFPAVFVKFHALDETLLNQDLSGLDIGFASFFVVTRLNYELNNPIREACISSLMPNVHMMRGIQYKATPPSEARRKIVRNRWRLAVWLHNYKSLRQLRYHAIEKAKIQEDMEKEMERDQIRWEESELAAGRMLLSEQTVTS
eukprot:gnl/TRDRNA2_/TRDRNA2_137635_c1_seq1.p1 gnl/TRDRNA2_/TRDRNA2_137635_c1~~gnl/TRDRNA2_/TRDRNA2_137635_c1_seq1.p1  ORF type:complete len:820 (-),score=119.40 gnl/TRDRNA2_/TRDRNA2_137635_c1_seq1:58-2466(-)